MDSQTPSHHPTYNVKFSQATIAAIVSRVYPGGKLVQCQQLPHGKSFNNRIYFLNVKISTEDGTASPLQLVLKLCGHYFGSTKIQNEVGALLLLNGCCPTLPSSRVVAWSEDGKSISILDNTQVRRLTVAASPHGSADHDSIHGWVLQTRLPGRMLTFEDLDGPYGPSILQRLAACMATWRVSIPDPGLIGGLRFAQDGSLGILAQRSAHPALGASGLTVGGLILTHQYDPEALQSWADYYVYQLRDQYEHLVKSTELSKLRDAIQERVSDLLLQLPKLPFLSNTNIRFSHMDFSPRNILVSEDETGVLVVTGILDFEFAAFLPSPSDFLNSLVNQSDDWPLQHYRTIMRELQKLELEKVESSASDQTIDLPSMEPPSEACKNAARCLCSSHTLRHLSVLESIIGSTAPWWISATSHIGKEEELELECAKAANIVLDGIQTLGAFWDGSAQ